MEKEHRERLKRVAKYAVTAVMGAVAVKNIRERSAVRHISYWEASQTFIIDFIPDGVRGSIRLAGKVLYGPEGKSNVQDVELYEEYEYSEDQIQTLEKRFAPDSAEPENPLQTG